MYEKDPHAVMMKQKIEWAMYNNKLIIFDYIDSKMKLSRNRTCEPMQITEEPTKNGLKYGVGAWDFNKQDMRFFSFEGIQDLRIITPVEYYEKLIKEL